MPLVVAWDPSPVTALLLRTRTRDANDPPSAPISVCPEGRGEGMQSWEAKRGHPGVQTHCTGEEGAATGMQCLPSWCAASCPHYLCSLSGHLLAGWYPKGSLVILKPLPGAVRGGSDCLRIKACTNQKANQKAPRDQGGLRASGCMHFP